MLWSKNLESSCKDVECVFGRLKGRFRILKIPSLFWYQHEIDNVFFTCCILHNILLEWDGLATDWGGDEGEIEWEEVGAQLQFVNRAVTLSRDFDASGVGRVRSLLAGRTEVEVERETSFDDLRSCLVTHMWVAVKRGEVSW
mmetsp:Transcript_67276/g.140130  ORF Transcript_67276/g.140130 Transcript_67276/m.140130 type:complete len:142 (+) Transcript_67276:1009-1434(+)